MATRIGPGVGKPQTSTASRSQTGNIQKPSEVPVSRSQSQTSVMTGNRKHLPQIPANAPVLAPPSPMIMDRSVLPAGGDAGFQPFFLEYALISEYGAVVKDKLKLQGIYVVPSAKSALVWNGVLFVRQGLYEDGVFRFTVHIPLNFPDGDCPLKLQEKCYSIVINNYEIKETFAYYGSVVFNPPVFHPVIDPVTGNLDVVRAFHKWRRSVNRISQVLLYARRIFLKIESKDPLNGEAADLYENNLAMYKTRVLECVERSKETLYKDPDPSDAHAIRFSPWDSAVHEPAKQKMLFAKSDNNSKAVSSSSPDS